VKSEAGPPMTLGSAAAAGVRVIVWCWDGPIRSNPTPPSSPRSTAPEPRFSILALFSLPKN
jgi:hypothetical protein